MCLKRFSLILVLLVTLCARSGLTASKTFTSSFSCRIVQIPDHGKITGVELMFWIRTPTDTSTVLATLDPPEGEPATVVDDVITIYPWTPSSSKYYRRSTDAFDGREMHGQWKLSVTVGGAEGSLLDGEDWQLKIDYDPPAVEPPRFSLDEGIYARSISVEIDCNTPDTTIRYTTDGSEPNLTSPLYNEPISIDTTTMLQAKAWNSDFVSSDVASATYTLVDRREEYDFPDTTWVSQPGTETATIPIPEYGQIRYVIVRLYIDISSSVSTDWYLRRSYLNANLTSPEGTSLPLVSGWETYHDASSTTTCTHAFDGQEMNGLWNLEFSLSSGYFPNSQGAELTSWSLTVYYDLQHVSTPTFSHEGGTYADGMTVRIGCNTPDAAIHYTTDGTEPTLASPTYANPLWIGTTARLKTRAWRTGYVPSGINAASFTISNSTFRLLASTGENGPSPLGLVELQTDPVDEAPIGSGNLIGTRCLDMAPDGRLYGLGDYGLGLIDPEDGACEVRLTTISGIPSEGVLSRDMAFDSDGVLYMAVMREVGVNQYENEFYRVATSGVATEVCCMPASVECIEFSPDGVLYADLAGLEIVDLVASRSTPVGSVSPQRPAIHAMDFAPDGFIYALGGVSSDSNRMVYQIDPSSGEIVEEYGPYTSELTNLASQPVERFDPSAIPIVSDVPVHGLAGEAGSQTLCRITVPAGSAGLEITTSRGTGDVDLYVRKGVRPTLEDCDEEEESAQKGNGESIAVKHPQAATYYIMLVAYAEYEDVTLRATYTAPEFDALAESPFEEGVTLLQSGVPVTDLSDAVGGQRFYKINVPPRQNLLTIETAGGSGDLDLYVRKGAKPTTNDWDERPYSRGNDERAVIENPEAARYYIMLNAAQAYSGATLLATYEVLIP